MQSDAFSAPAPDASRQRIGLLPSKSCTSALTFLLAIIAAPAALANGASESSSWQFQTSADKVNQAAVLDMIEKRKNGYYTAPVYTTYIDRQINCNLSANATGNDSLSSSVANSPSTSGATSDATGNQNTNTLDSEGGNSASSTQGNSGAVGSGVTGGTSTHVNGTADQALNTSQNNSGTQSANVGGSTGCTFGVLN